MDDLVRWLGEQLDEDGRIARAATWCDDAASWHAEPSPFGARDNGQRWYVEDSMDDGLVTHVDPVASDDEGVARHIAEHDPARVLRQIEAKRELLALHAAEWIDTGDADGNDRSGYFCAECDGKTFPCRTLRLLAAVYADRPGYQEGWAP